MLLCMRTTIVLNDDLLRAAKRRAAEEGITLREVFERALRMHLTKRAPRKARFTLRWKTEAGRLQPGISIDDRSTLIDAMEGRA